MKYILLLPLSYNDGSESPKEVKERIFDRLFCIADGYTIAGKVRGAYWMASGKKKVDWAMREGSRCLLRRISGMKTKEQNILGPGRC